MTLAVILLQQQIPRVRLRFISGPFYRLWEGFYTEMTVPSNILQHVRTYDTYSMHIKHNTAGTLLFISNYVLVRLRTVTTIRYTSV